VDHISFSDVLMLD